MMPAMHTWVVAALVLTGCALEQPDDGEHAESSDDAIQTQFAAGPATEFPEAVQIIFNGGRDFCTGTLVSKSVVLTAAHCIDGSSGWKVTAPYAPGTPTVATSGAEVESRSFANDPASPDVGVLHLAKPITIAHYPALTDVSRAVDTGKTLAAVAVGRKAQAPTSPLYKTKTLRVVTDVPAGYRHGVRTPDYSAGGDSGGGLFLVENNKVTHKLVGLERQPDGSAQGVDHFTRLDPTVLGWLRARL